MDESQKPASDLPAQPQQEQLLSIPDPVEKPVRMRVKLTKLERLECWPEVFAMLESGDAVAEIANYIQLVRKEYNHVGHRSLVRVINLWISRNQTRVADRLPTVHLQLASTVPHIDPLDGLNMIFAIQMDRVNSLYATEKRMKVINPRTEKELRLANEILATMGELESKAKRYSPPPPSGGSGATPLMNQLEQLRELYTNKYGAAVSKVILSDESRRKVLNALEHMRRGDSDALKKILERNAKKAQELEERDRQRAMEEAAETENTVDVEVTEP